eukprot:scaffold18513_cov101-Isochrysis_galbana.AAC.2
MKNERGDGEVGAAQRRPHLCARSKGEGGESEVVLQSAAHISAPERGFLFRRTPAHQSGPFHRRRAIARRLSAPG